MINSIVISHIPHIEVIHGWETNRLSFKYFFLTGENYLFNLGETDLLIRVNIFHGSGERGDLYR